MADWDEDAPGDSDFVSQFPPNERAARAAVKTNFGVEHEEDPLESHIGRHHQATLIEKASDPTAVPGTGIVYTKDHAGEVELFFRDDSGVVHALLQGGARRPVVKSSAYTAKAGDWVLATGNAFTVTLPASPSVGDRVKVTDAQGNASTQNKTIARNGENIRSTAENLVIDSNYFTASLVYVSASIGWAVELW